MKRRERLNQIINIIENNRISTQQQVVDKLVLLNFNITQATVSRDIKELKLIKEHDVEGSYYVYNSDRKTLISKAESLSTIIIDNVVKIDLAEFLLVLHTNPGGAPVVAFYLDQNKITGIVGTLAGDDTVLIITNSKETALDIYNKWRIS